VLLGQNCHIGRGVELGPNAVIGNNVFVDQDATISQSTVLDGTYVGRLVNLQNRIVSGDLAIDIHSSDYVVIEDDFILSDYEESVHLGMRRVFDAAAALVFLILLSPLLLVLAMMAWLTTGSSLRQVEHASPGSKGTKFTLWHFNTGRDHLDNWFGRWMEAWELNRLPELWNVVTGELRLVGLKPLLPNEVFEANRDAWDLVQEDYVPGFTGLWYVETGIDADLLEILVTDAYYMATRSIKSDLKVIARTPVRWARRTPGKTKQVIRQEVVRRDGNLVEYDQ
jgi:lipopolysaccharide/colanic/teichoic acid biosynthesis glycosyltransferase